MSILSEVTDSTPPPDNTAIIGFTGPRAIGSSAWPLVKSVVGHICTIKSRVAVGCSDGVDKQVLAEALRIAPTKVAVFAIFNQKHEGSIGISNLSGVQRAHNLGALVTWQAGGDLTAQTAVRLARRSQAMVRYVGNGPRGSGIIGFINDLPPHKFSLNKAWPQSGSGTWSTLAAANYLDLPVMVFPIEWGDFKKSVLPDLPGNKGEWTQVLNNSVFAGGYLWTKSAK